MSKPKDEQQTDARSSYSFRRHKRLPLSEYRVDCIRSGDEFTLARQGNVIDVALCSVRAPSCETDLGLRLGAAMTELLIFKKVKISKCCRDSEGRQRVILSLVTTDPQLGKFSVNELLKAGGFGLAEPECRNGCSPLSRATTSGWKGWLFSRPADRAERWSETRLPGPLRRTAKPVR